MTVSEEQLSLPCVETTKGYLTTLCNNEVKALSVDKKGEISLSTNRQGGEEWLLIPVEGEDEWVYIRSVKYGYYLNSKLDSKLCSSKDEEAWTVLPSGDGKFQLLSQEHGVDMHLALAADNIQTVSGSFNGFSIEWTVELLSGELCYLSCLEYEKQVHCNLLGQPTMKADWSGWGVWRFIAVGNQEYMIISCSHNKLLCSNSAGKVYTHDRKTGPGRTWFIRKNALGTGVVVESASHLRLLGFDGMSLCTNTLKDADAVSLTWQLEPANRNKFILSNLEHNIRLSREKDGLTTSENRQDDEHWRIDQICEGFLELYACKHGGYLGVESGKTPVVDDKPTICSRWEVRPSPHGGVVLLHAEKAVVLSCDETGSLTCVMDNQFGRSETWILEPCMPQALTSQQLLTIAAVGVGVGVAAPAALVSTVYLMGFTSTGIVGGSYAAGMMSAEAIASGGGVFAGGTVATLQSIGVVGLGTLGTSSAFFAGAFVGSTGARAWSRKQTVGSDLNQEDANSQPNKPLASWRTW